MKKGWLETTLKITTQGFTVERSWHWRGDWELLNLGHGDIQYLIDKQHGGVIQGQGPKPRQEFLRFIYMPYVYVPVMITYTETASVWAVTEVYAENEAGLPYYHWLVASEWEQAKPKVLWGFDDKRYKIAVQAVPGEAEKVESGYWHGMSDERDPARILMEKHWKWVRRVFG